MRLPIVLSFLIISAAEPIFAQNAYVRLGKQAYVDGDFKSAVVQLEKACLIDSTNSNALWMLGYSYYHSDNFAKSIIAFSKELSITPTDAYAYYYRARAKCRLFKDGLFATNERERYMVGAIFDFSKAISINPNDSKIASFYQNRGLAYKDYGAFKLQGNARGYDRIRGINSLKAAIDDLDWVLTNDPSRADISSLIDQTKEQLATAVGHR